MRSLTPSLSLLLLFLGAVAPHPGSAQQPDPTGHPGSYWSGAFCGVGLLAGPTYIGNEVLDSSWGLAFGAKARVAMVLTMFDLQLAYLHSLAQASIQDRTLHLSGDSLGLSLGFHPLFFWNLFSSDLGPSLAMFTLQAGVSLEFNRFEWGEEALSELGKVGWHLGLSADLPLDDLEDGSSFWLGAGYRYNLVPTDLSLLPSDESSLRQHLFLLRFTYRVNRYLL